MKKLFFFAFGLTLLLTNCNRENKTPKYSDFKNDWERDNLYGSVKAITMYKANITDAGTEKTENPILQFKKEFTDFGKISNFDFYDRNGNINQYQKNEYNNKNLCIRTISENRMMNSKTSEEFNYDQNGNRVNSVLKSNDSVSMRTKAEFDKANHIIKSISIQKDTSICDYIYKFDEKHRITEKKQVFSIYEKKSEQINEYKYDKSGNIIEMIYKSELMKETKTKNEYDKENVLVKRLNFEDGQPTTELTYDKYFNVTSTKYYEKKVLTKEIHFDYKFDEHQNWTEKKVSIKQYFSSNPNFIPIFVEMRTLEYYK